MGDDLDEAILKATDVGQLLESLNEIPGQESVIIRGQNRLLEFKKGLEVFRIVVDAAAPLAKVEPTAATVFGVVSGMTSVSVKCRHYYQAVPNDANSWRSLLLRWT
jgi:hypothetical protein